MNNPPVRALVGTTAVASIGLGTFFFAASKKASTPAPPPSLTKVAVDSKLVEDARQELAEQLQRRFYNRKELEFGYDRVVRPNARLHFGPAANRSETEAQERASQAIYEKHRGKDGWVGADRKWHTGRYREMFIAENSKEAHAVSRLMDGPQTVIYTAGLFDPSHEPQRLKGPAYLSYEGVPARNLDEPRALGGELSRTWLTRVAKQLWTRKSVTSNGWRFVAHKIIADGPDCVKCHNDGEQYYDGVGKPKRMKVGDPIGLILIASRTGPQVP